MTERTMIAGDNGKSDDDDDDQTVAPISQENQPDHSSAKNLPIKKRGANTHQRQQDSDPIIQVDQIPQENTSPDHSEGKLPGPCSKVLPCEKAYCISKTLNWDDIIPINPELHLTAYEACVLTRSLKIIDSLPGSYKKNLVVSDEADRKYNMILSHHIDGEYIRYSVSADWERFVKVHNLQAGDKVSFYRIPNGNVDDDCHYILKYVRRSSPVFKVNHRAVLPENTVTGPGSRVVTREAYCLSKTLTSIEVVRENAKLYFDPYDASVLTGCPEIRRRPLGKYSKDLIVFDGNNTKYTMNLSHCISGGEIRSYCLDTDWNRFLRTHGLKENDELTFYRFSDKSVSEDCYYVLKYFRNVAVKKDEHDESTELKVAKIPQKKTEESKVGDNEVLLANARDWRRRNAQGPGSRALTRETYCLSKTLSTFEVVREGIPRLYFDAYEASRLTGCRGILGGCPLRALLKHFLVFDTDDRRYDMLLSCFETDYGEMIYTLDCGWQRFVRVHDLRAGDEIFIHRIQDQSVYDECYYVIKYTRRPAGRRSG